MENRFLKNYNLYLWIVWVILSICLFMQFSSRAPLGESLLFTLCFVIFAFTISTLMRKRVPKAMINKKLKGFAFEFIIAVFVLAFLLALVVELFYKLENNGVFAVSPLISDIHDPMFISVLTMLPTSIMAIAGFCGLELLRTHAVLENERLKDQLNFLKSQVNPHLTFNVLNHIHILMRKDMELADELLLRFSDVLRYQLYECNKEVILLESELKYVKDIVEIEKMRWGNELDVTSVWEVKDNMVTIRPLMLIPFIENAFKHVSRLPDKKGYVNIHFSQKGNAVHLSIENSKSIIPPRKKDSSGLGLRNTQKRLEISYPEKHWLDIEETDNKYIINLRITLQ
jgi:Putative regulator of cell autolysis